MSTEIVALVRSQIAADIEAPLLADTKRAHHWVTATRRAANIARNGGSS